MCKKREIYIKIICIIGVMFAILIFNNKGVYAAAAKNVKIDLTKSNISINKGSSYAIYYSTSMYYGGVVSWKIANGNVASAKADYTKNKITIYGNKHGTTSIKVWLDNGNSSTCNIKVIDPTKIDFTKSNININKGSSYAIYYSTSMYYNGNISWKIANGNVASAKAYYKENKLIIYGNKPGTTSIKIWLENGNSSTCTITCSQQKIDIANAEITNIKNAYTYIGKEIRPDPTVKYNGKVLTKYTDYVVSYINNIYQGTKTGTIEITGIGNYFGKKIKKFSIFEGKLQTLTDKQKSLLTQLAYIEYSAEKINKCTELSDLIYVLEDGDTPYLGTLGKLVEINTTPKELINQLINADLGDLKLKGIMKNGSSGFFAIAFEDNMGNVGFSFRGTETKKLYELLIDSYTDVIAFFNNGTASAQIEDAKKFYLNKRTLTANNFLYGHSLGGNLVENVYAANYNNITEAFLINPFHMNKSNLNDSQKNAFYNIKKFKCYIIEGDWVSGLISDNCNQYNVVSNKKLQNPTYNNNTLIISRISYNTEQVKKIINGAYCHTIEAASFNKKGKFLLK